MSRSAQRGFLTREQQREHSPLSLRNRLVHEYDQIDDAIILAAIPETRRLFAAYVAEVEQHLANQGF